jgi:hypothetical protein
MDETKKHAIKIKPVPRKTPAEQVSREMKLRLDAASIKLLLNSGEDDGCAYLYFSSLEDTTNAMDVLDGSAAFGMPNPIQACLHPIQAPHEGSNSTSIIKHGAGAEEAAESDLLKGTKLLKKISLESNGTLKIASEMSMKSGKTQTVSIGTTTDEVIKHANGTLTTVHREISETSTVFMSGNIPFGKLAFPRLGKQLPASKSVSVPASQIVSVPASKPASVDELQAATESRNMLSLLKNRPLPATAIPVLYEKTFHIPLSYKERGETLSGFLSMVDGVVKLPPRSPSTCSWYGLGQNA